MAASTSPTHIEKRRLKNTPVYLNRVEKCTTCVYCRLKWTVCRFRKLKKAIHYKTYIPLLNWCLSLYKDRHSLYINIVPKGYSEIIKCYICSSPSSVTEVEKTGRYEYQIPFADIEDPENKLFYEEDKLYLEFRFISGVQPISGIRPFTSTRGDEEVYELINELRDSIEKNFEPNFSLHLEDGHVDFRKDILAARCEFFYNYLKQNPDSTEYQISATEELIQQLKRYVIFGSIEKPTDLRQKLDGFMLADFLDIPFLQFRFDVMIEDIVNAGIVPHQIEGRLKGRKEFKGSLLAFLVREREKEIELREKWKTVEGNFTRRKVCYL